MSHNTMAGDAEAAGAIAGMVETYGTCGFVDAIQDCVDELRDISRMAEEEARTTRRRGCRKYDGKKSETPAKVRRAIEILSFVHGQPPSIVEIADVVACSPNRAFTAAMEEVRAGRLSHIAGKHRSWRVTKPEFRPHEKGEPLPGVPMDVLVTDPSEVE